MLAPPPHRLVQAPVQETVQNCNSMAKEPIEGRTISRHRGRRNTTAPASPLLPAIPAMGVGASSSSSAGGSGDPQLHRTVKWGAAEAETEEQAQTGASASASRSPGLGSSGGGKGSNDLVPQQNDQLFEVTTQLQQLISEVQNLASTQATMMSQLGRHSTLLRDSGGSGTGQSQSPMLLGSDPEGVFGGSDNALRPLEA